MERKIEEQLLAWKNKTDDRLPLIVNGARQVGKTYILRKFGEEQFKNVVYINLETNLTIASYFNDNIAPVEHPENCRFSKRRLLVRGSFRKKR